MLFRASNGSPARAGHDDSNGDDDNDEDKL